ncbi:MAG TPA: stage II sporulation protein M [Solirubrobacteraceae bacterium]|nr:stage II sporulation protein M [Solirubrobacteraceae bacterium]
MNLNAFVSEGAPAWQELETLLERAGSRPERLGVEGVLELGARYRALIADLALARRCFPGDPVLERLEPLALRARQAVYSERRRRGSLYEFFARVYWRELRAHRALLAVSLTAMFAPTLLAAAWAVHDPGAAIGLVPSAYRAAADPHVRHLSVGLTTQAALASSIYTHNIAVTFLVFAGGLALGAGTLALLAYNGLLLGTLAGLTIQAGTFSVFVRYIVPHGLLELSCFSIAGVAGLRLARALIEPGVRARGEALRADARGAVLMVLGTAPWLVLAGLTEGFVTPRGLPVADALAVGCALATLFWGLALTRGRHMRTRAFARR